MVSKLIFILCGKLLLFLFIIKHLQQQYCMCVSDVFTFSHQNLYVQLGAVAVNLVAGDKPADVYSGIAERLAVF